MIHLRALGPLEVNVDGAAAPAELLWRHNIALLLYLARTPAHRCTRDHAIGLLWPDKDQAAARQSLREAVRILRRHVGELHLRAEGDQLELRPAAVELDTDRFDQLIAAGEWSAATPLVRGGFAEGFMLPEASAFEDWLLTERWHWRARAMDALVRHAEQRLGAGDLLGADEPARRALALDPQSDRALRTLMLRLALAHERAAALALYGEFAQRRAREGAAPEPETRALAERVQRTRVWQLPAERPAAPAGTSRRTPLIGRERELAALETEWRAARAGRATLAWIEAHAGGGKTRLAEELAARVTLDGGACVTTRGVPGDREHPLSAIEALARGGLLDVPGVAGASPGALAAFVHTLPEWADRFPGARGVTPIPLSAALVDVLRAASIEQPLLLVLDDAHWLDDASFDAADALLRDLPRAPVLVLVTAIPEPLSERATRFRARIGREVPGRVAVLSALDERALDALTRWAFPSYGDEQIARLVRRIAADSAGVPLLVVEICHAVAQGLDMDAALGAWPRPFRTLEQTRPGDLPETIVAAIRVGFNCLTPPAQAALRAVAVLGDRVSAERIGAAAGLEGTALHAALDELEWRRWVVADGRGYDMVARIVGEVVARDMVTAGQRERIRASG